MKTMTLIVFVALVSISTAMASTDSPCCNLGDANGDGILSAGDLLAIDRHLLGLTCMTADEQCQSDVDGDGVVTANDLNLIREYQLGIRKSFPRCGDLDGDGTLEWDTQNGPADDMQVYMNCMLLGSGCPNVDADNDGDYDLDDVALFRSHERGFITSFPGCACGEGACG